MQCMGFACTHAYSRKNTLGAGISLNHIRTPCDTGESCHHVGMYVCTVYIAIYVHLSGNANTNKSVGSITRDTCILCMSCTENRISRK